MKKAFIAFLLGVVAAGCGGPGGTTVNGKVEFDDGSPLSKGVVTFSGDEGSYRGPINEDGTYTLENVLAGEYRVVITGAKEGGEAPEMQYDEEGNYIEPENPPEETPLIDMKYTNPSSSGLTVEVPSDDYTLKVTKPAE